MSVFERQKNQPQTGEVVVAACTLVDGSATSTGSKAQARRDAGDVTFDAQGGAGGTMTATGGAHFSSASPRGCVATDVWLERELRSQQMVASFASPPTREGEIAAVLQVHATWQRGVAQAGFVVSAAAGAKAGLKTNHVDGCG